MEGEVQSLEIAFVEIWGWKCVYEGRSEADDAGDDGGLHGVWSGL